MAFRQTVIVPLLSLMALSGLVISSCSRQTSSVSAPSSALEDWHVWLDKAKAFTPKPGARGGKLIFTSFGTGAKTFNPITSTETSSFEVLQFLFEGLTVLDVANQTLVPCLAKSWTLSEDKKTYDFELRQDVTWSDGVPFTADDVVFTFDVIFDKKNLANARDMLSIRGKTPSVKKTGDHSVRIQLPYVFAPFLKMLVGTTTPIIPRHKLQQAQKKGEFSSTWEVNTAPEQIVGTGPFTAASYRASEQMVLRRNAHYWKKDSAGTALPYLDSVVFVYVKDQSVEMLRFQSGESDYFEMRGEDYPILKPQEQQGNFTIYNLGPAMGDLFIMFNQNPGLSKETRKSFVDPAKLRLFRSRDFRRAVAHCIDKQQMINIVHNGLAQPQITPFNEAGGYFYNPNAQGVAYNPDSAKALLAGLGLRDADGDSVLEDSAGNKVEFTVHTNAGNTNRLAYCEIIRKDLAKVGIKMYVAPLEFNHIIDKIDHTYEWDAIVLGLTGTEEPHDGNNVWQSSARNHLWYPNQKRPSTDWEARIDEIYNLGATEMDRARRKALYDEWQEIFADQVPYVELVSPFRLFAVRNKFGNLDPAPSAEGMYYLKRKFFHNIEEVFVKQ